MFSVRLCLQLYIIYHYAACCLNEGSREEHIQICCEPAAIYKLRALIHSLDLLVFRWGKWLRTRSLRDIDTSVQGGFPTGVEQAEKGQSGGTQIDLEGSQGWCDLQNNVCLCPFWWSSGKCKHQFGIMFLHAHPTQHWQLECVMCVCMCHSQKLCSPMALVCSFSGTTKTCAQNVTPYSANRSILPLEPGHKT
jgi:hypothetical protein